MIGQGETGSKLRHQSNIIERIRGQCLLPSELRTRIQSTALAFASDSVDSSLLSVVCV